MDKQIDFLAIGDLVVDDFIRIKDAEATCDLDQEHCKLCVRFGWEWYNCSRYSVGGFACRHICA
jgi:hypothetical protein